jgi:redox-sensing transcriptional repressor
MDTYESQTQNIPASVIRRLPRYLTQAQRLRLEGVAWVSSSLLAETLGLTSSTVRQDLSYIDFKGVSKRGYSSVGLETALARTLGVDRDVVCVLVGAGNLGRALAMHEGFARQGFKIVAVFDNNPALVGRKIGLFAVQGMEELAPKVASDGVDIGIVSVPHDAAQEVADLLTAAGVRGLLNMTTAHLQVPGAVSVVDVRILLSLRELAYRVRSR